MIVRFTHILGQRIRSVEKHAVEFLYLHLNFIDNLRSVGMKKENKCMNGGGLFK